jgi:hypothetical protein
MTTTVTAATRYVLTCPVPMCDEELERTHSKFEGWADVSRHLAFRHPELVEEIPITRTVVEEDVQKTEEAS